MSVQIGPAWVGRVIARWIRAMTEMADDVDFQLGCVQPAKRMTCLWCDRPHDASGCPPLPPEPWLEKQLAQQQEIDDLVMLTQQRLIDRAVGYL